MRIIHEWWVATFPDNRAETTLIELFLSYQKYAELDILKGNFITPNQFVKCLVAAKIADAGGRFAMLENWEPKPYEIARAKVY